MKTNLDNSTSILLYNGVSITFELKEKDVMVNLTEMAKAFGKRPNDFLSLPSTNQLISAITRKYGNSDCQIVIQKPGSPQFGGGTWGNRLIALSFAQWLSVDFHLLCLEKIEELLTTGKATLQKEESRELRLAKALLEASEIVEEYKATNVALMEKNETLTEENKTLAPKAKYTDKVLMSETTYTMTQVAKEFGMGASAFSDFLFKKKVIYRQSGMWMMFAKYDNEGYSAVRTKTIDKNRGSVFTSSYLVWTEKGRMFLHNKFDKELNVDTQLDMFD